MAQSMKDGGKIIMNMEKVDL